MALTLRPAVAEDAPAAAAVLLASRKAFLPFAPLAHGDEEVAHWVRELLLPAGGTTVAREGSELVGLLATADDGHAAWIEQLYLAPGWTGRGIGTRLLKQVLPMLRGPVRLYCFEANLAACRFYERFGFLPIAYSDGQRNEERCPDVLYELP